MQLREKDLVKIEGQRFIINDLAPLRIFADLEKTDLSLFQLNDLFAKK